MLDCVSCFKTAVYEELASMQAGLFFYNDFLCYTLALFLIVFGSSYTFVKNAYLARGIAPTYLLCFLREVTVN